MLATRATQVLYLENYTVPPRRPASNSQLAGLIAHAVIPASASGSGGLSHPVYPAYR